MHMYISELHLTCGRIRGFQVVLASAFSSGSGQISAVSNFSPWRPFSKLITVAQSTLVRCQLEVVTVVVNVHVFREAATVGQQHFLTCCCILCFSFFVFESHQSCIHDKFQTLGQCRGRMTPVARFCTLWLMPMCLL